jgi:leader peptidase (prepilin peptidase)/N-methyltransferase
LPIGVIGAIAVYVSIISVPGGPGLVAAAFALVMLTIAAIDWRSFIIPDWLNAIGFALALANAAALEPAMMVQAMVMAALRGVALALVFLILRFVYAQLRGRQGLGLGDVKLALVAGAWLDWLMIPVAIELAAFSALSAYLWRHLVRGQSLSASSRLPFGLFFAPAIWICWVLEIRWLGPF